MRRLSWREWVISAFRIQLQVAWLRWEVRRRQLSERKRSRHPRLPRIAAVERLELRILPTITLTASGGSASFSGGSSDNLYLKVVNGTLLYGTDNSQYVTAGVTVTKDSTISADIGGTLYLSGMDQGGGTYSNTSSGKVSVIGNLTTGGEPLTLTGQDISIANDPVLGTSGTLTGSNGQTFLIVSENTTNNTIALNWIAGPSALAEGASLIYSADPGISSGGLANGTSYLVHVVDPTNPVAPTVQLYRPGITISTASQSGAGGAVTLTAPTINVGAFNQILAQGVTGDGDITFTATDTKTGTFGLSLVNQAADIFNHSFSTKITIGNNAVVAGGDVSMTSTAGDLSLFANASGTDEFLLSVVASPLANYVNQWASLPISVLKADATAYAEVGEYARIQSSGQVTISTTATANATGEATWWFRSFGLGASFSYAKGTTDAESLVDDHAVIQATGGGGVSVTASTTTTTSGTSLVSQNTSFSDAPENPNNIQLSGGYNQLTTTTYATLGHGATIDSPQGPVTFSATAADTNSLNIQTASYKDGSVGLSGGGASVNADVQARVDGNIVAGIGDGSTPLAFNPFQESTGSNLSRSVTSTTVDYANSRFVLNADPGYATGESLLYSSGNGGAIRGLKNRNTYFAMVSQSPDKSEYWLQLAASRSDAQQGNAISFGQYPTLNGIPVTEVDPAANQIVWDFDPGFSEGELVTVTPAAGQFLGARGADGTLTGPLQGSYLVHLAGPTGTDGSRYAIQLRDTQGTLLELDTSASLTLGTGQMLRVRGFNAEADKVILDPSDLPAGFVPANGTAVVYTQGLAAAVTGLTDGATYYLVVDPDEFAGSNVNPPTVRLATTANEAAASNPAVRSPTLTWTNVAQQPQTTTIPWVQPALASQLFGVGHAYTILSSDPTSQSLVVALQSDATVLQLTNGELLTYQGAVGTTGTLRDGATYEVTVLDQSNPAAIQIQLRDVLRLPTYGTVTVAGNLNQSLQILGINPGNSTLEFEFTG
ncbi:MAG: hypothetical protein NT069_07195, partial [Planctomycetota bacterium]|nr:hypothetical protein [Planctomycetota bacterium]